MYKNISGHGVTHALVFCLVFTMSKIKILSAHEAHKIAAGEVVERPANIIKELIENSIDAAATHITLSISDGGKQSIRIIDNGYGMSPDDAQLCFIQYATSKISTVDQLESITTFGFRGEALASIAAVSRVTLRTKEANALFGTQVIAHDGTQTVTTVAANQGTEIIVEDLFATIPARKKFLKSEQTEYRQIMQLVTSFCLNYPTIHFKFFNETNLILNCSPVSTLLQRSAQLWPTNTVEQLIEIAPVIKDTHLKIEGIISDYNYGAYDRSNLFFLVNNRWVKNQKLTSALLKGYHNVIQQNRFPLVCLRITIDPTLIDVNIHPRKEEIRFLHPVIVEQHIQYAVKQALEQKLSAHMQQSVSFAPLYSREYSKRTENTFPSSQEIFVRNYTNEHNTGSSSFLSQSMASNTPMAHNVPAASHEAWASVAPSASTQLSPSPESIADNRRIESYGTIIGQYKNTYILIEKEEGLFLIDQHAAHERILYELFSARFDQVPTINLIFPTIISLLPQDIETLEPFLALFVEQGIAIELFGKDKLIIKSTPVYFKDQSLESVIHHAITWINESQTLDPVALHKNITEKLHAQMACKAAVKAGDILSHTTILQLLHDLEKTDNRFCCPHGRPTSWLLRLDEIEKKFKRK